MTPNIAKAFKHGLRIGWRHAGYYVVTADSEFLAGYYQEADTAARHALAELARRDAPDES